MIQLAKPWFLSAPPSNYVLIPINVLSYEFIKDKLINDNISSHLLRNLSATNKAFDTINLWGVVFGPQP